MNLYAFPIAVYAMQGQYNWAKCNLSGTWGLQIKGQGHRWIKHVLSWLSVMCNDISGSSAVYGVYVYPNAVIYHLIHKFVV